MVEVELKFMDSIKKLRVGNIFIAKTETEVTEAGHVYLVVGLRDNKVMYFNLTSGIDMHTYLIHPDSTEPSIDILPPGTSVRYTTA